MSGVTIAWDEAVPPITEKVWKGYRGRNRAKALLRIKKYKATAKGKATARAQYLANKQKYQEYSKKRRAANPDCRKEEYRRWKARTPNHREIKRADFLRRKYGISLADYDAMVASQKGGCAVCGGPPPSKRYFSVDHDHATGAVRGLLCQKCNTLVGYFEKTPDLIMFKTRLYISAAKALTLVA